MSILLMSGLLESVMSTLEEAGVVVDERRPDVIRVAPAPLYNHHRDIARFADVFAEACNRAWQGQSTDQDGKTSTITEGGKNAKGWSEIA